MPKSPLGIALLLVLGAIALGAVVGIMGLLGFGRLGGLIVIGLGAVYLWLRGRGR